MAHKTRPRSRAPEATALRLLEEAIRDGAPKLVVLSDDRGVVARVGSESFDAMQVARLGSAWARGAPPDDATVDAVVGEEDVYAHALSVGRKTLVLTSVGARVRSVRALESALAIAATRAS